MNITWIETIRSSCRHTCWILLHTDEGITGVGETHSRADPAEVIIREFARDILLGSNGTPGAAAASRTGPRTQRGGARTTAHDDRRGLVIDQ